MSKPQDAQRASFPFGNPFRMILPKNSYLSPKLLSLLTAFEQSLAESLAKLSPKSNSDILSFSWIKQAMKSLSETHINVKTLISALNFPVSDWEEKWMDMYLDNSVKILDVCNALTSELSKLDQSQLFLKYALHMLASNDTSVNRVHNSLHDYMEKINSKNQKLENCFSILQELTSTLQLGKVKNSAKGKVLMRALYGVKFVTIYICSIFAVALSGGSMQPVNLQVSGDLLWAQAFHDLQDGIDGEIKNKFLSGSVAVIKEMGAVSVHVKKLHDLSTDAENEEALGVELKELIPKLASDAEVFATELDFLSKQLEEFFQIVLEGRNALLSSFSASAAQHKGKVDKL